jgi:hypothetical protein
VSRTPLHLSTPTHASTKPYVFTRNDPYDRTAPIEYIAPRLLDSRTYMRMIREFDVPTNDLAIWYLGQNGFLLIASPESFREALDEAGADAILVLMKYYEPWLYRRHETGLSLGPT